MGGFPLLLKIEVLHKFMCNIGDIIFICDTRRSKWSTWSRAKPSHLSEGCKGSKWCSGQRGGEGLLGLQGHIYRGLQK